jgi:hypothetical protein
MRALLPLLALALAGCAVPSNAVVTSPSPRVAGTATARPRPVASGPFALDYTFTLDAGLNTLGVRLCPRGALPPRLVPGMREARSMLKRALIEREGAAVELPLDEHGILLAGLRQAECVRYELDLRIARGGMGAPKVHRSGDALMANLAALLWRPADYARYTEVHARFELPPGMKHSVPWPRAGDSERASERPSDLGRYELDSSAFAFHAYAAFGELTMHQLHVTGSTIELAVLDGLSSAQCAAVARWVTVQANAFAMLAGRLPRAHLQIVVLPMGDASDPVRFGSMTRGGGASVGVLIAENFDEAELMADWVLVHELSHLLHPFVDRGQAWLSEGIATYYQEVLRARAGLQSPETAWKRILNGSQQGASMSVSLEQGAAEMHMTYRFAPVYWGGAAVMLLADVELRRRSGGSRTLDDVLMELSRCCGIGSRAWSAVDVGERIDAIAGVPVMRELIANVVRAETFPTLAALYAQLGLDEQGRAKAAAPLAHVRDAIMRPVSREPSLRAQGPGGTSDQP